MILDMGVNKQVFGSEPERRAFQRLSRNWGDKYRIYHNLPFLNVFNTENLLCLDGEEYNLQLSDSDRNKLKKTSIDFVFCDLDDAPVVCIEFDGLRKGFNAGTEYVTKAGPVKKGWRKVITELKLKVAHASMFPYVVVCSQYFEDISSQTRLSLVDAIIGDVLASRATQEAFSKGFNPEECGYPVEQFDALSESDKHEIMQDWVLSVELECSMIHNPIFRRSAELSQQVGNPRTSHSFLSYPELPEAISERAAAMENLLLNGARCVVTDRKGREFVGEAWVPNFKSPAVSGYGFLMEMAEVIALDKAVRNKP